MYSKTTWSDSKHFALKSQRFDHSTRGVMAVLLGVRSTMAVAGNASAAMDLSAFLSTCCFSGLRNLLHNQPPVQNTGLTHKLDTDFFFFFFL